MTNTGYYNWTEIISDFDDKEFFSAFVDRDSNLEKKKLKRNYYLRE